MTKHGQWGTRLYNVWKDMRRRCRNPARKDFKHYGGRGIKVCKRWDSYANFAADIAHLGDPSGRSIERIRVDEDYKPGNVKWATQREQVRNRRVTARIDGVPLAEIAEAAGIKYDTLYKRIHRGGWDLARATQPIETEVA